MMVGIRDGVEKVVVVDFEDVVVFFFSFLSFGLEVVV